MPSSNARCMIGDPGYGVNMFVQNSAPGKRRQTSIMSAIDSLRSASPSPGKPKIMLNDGRIPACESVASRSPEKIVRNDFILPPESPTRLRSGCGSQQLDGFIDFDLT